MPKTPFVALLTATLAATPLLGCLTAQGTQAGQDPQSEARLPEMSARKFRRLTVDGATVARNVERLTKTLRWHKSLGSALAAGRAEKRPIVWIQALGDLKGFL